jgi:hypothetical protein
MNRDRFFCGLFVLAAANGLEVYVVNSIVTQGWSVALFDLFGVSAIVWLACIAGANLLYSSRTGETLATSDAAVGLVVLVLTILPFERVSWFALTALSLYMLCVSPAQSFRRRGALIALALTGPMLWGPALMLVFGPTILKADAVLVSGVIGTDHVGNVFSGTIGSNGAPTQYVIYPDCSSLRGMSIAVLAFVTITNALGIAWSRRHFTFGLVATLSVLVVNVTRLSLIGLFPSHFSVIHGMPGSAIAAWLSLVLVIAISLIGVGRAAFVRT